MALTITEQPLTLVSWENSNSISTDDTIVVTLTGYVSGKGNTATTAIFRSVTDPPWGWRISHRWFLLDTYTSPIEIENSLYESALSMFPVLPRWRQLFKSDKAKRKWAKQNVEWGIWPYGNDAINSRRGERLIVGRHLELIPIISRKRSYSEFAVTTGWTVEDANDAKSTPTPASAASYSI